MTNTFHMSIIIANVLMRRVERGRITERKAMAGSFLLQKRLKTISERLLGAARQDTVIIRMKWLWHDAGASGVEPRVMMLTRPLQ